MSDTAVLPNDDILHLTTEITRGYVSRNELSIDQVPGLIKTVFNTLSTVGQSTAEDTKPQVLKPAVDPKKSVFPDHIICLEDGKKFKLLKRHLANEYNMTPDQYRAKWGLPPSYPVVAPKYAERRSSLAKASGLGLSRSKPVPQLEPAPSARKSPFRSKKAKTTRQHSTAASATVL